MHEAKHFFKHAQIAMSRIDADQRLSLRINTRANNN
jgi:hypothetical protein